MPVPIDTWAKLMPALFTFDVQRPALVDGARGADGRARRSRAPIASVPAANVDHREQERREREHERDAIDLLIGKDCGLV